MRLLCVQHTDAFWDHHSVGGGQENCPYAAGVILNVFIAADQPDKPVFHFKPDLQKRLPKLLHLRPDFLPLTSHAMAILDCS